MTKTITLVKHEAAERVDGRWPYTFNLIGLQIPTAMAYTVGDLRKGDSAQIDILQPWDEGEQGIRRIRHELIHAIAGLENKDHHPVVRHWACIFSKFPWRREAHGEPSTREQAVTLLRDGKLELP